MIPYLKYFVSGLDCDNCFAGTDITTKCVTKPCNTWEDMEESIKEFAKLTTGHNTMPSSSSSFSSSMETSNGGSETIKSGSGQEKFMCMKTVQTLQSKRFVSSQCVSAPLDPNPNPLVVEVAGAKTETYWCDETNAAKCKGEANIPVRPVGILVISCFFLVKLICNHAFTDQ
jgi:hypothetical protein